MEIIKFIQQFSNPFLDYIFIFITMIGEETFLILVMTLIYWCINKELALKVGFAYLMNGAVNSTLKDIFKAPRPIGQPGIKSFRVETAGGYSFPSGHTQSTASFWTSIMTYVKGKWTYILGSMVIVLVALSRIYLGVHYPRDVIAGALIGITMVFVSNAIFDFCIRTQRKYLLLLFILPALVGMFVFQNSNFPKVSGAVCGFILGCVAELRYIDFKPSNSMNNQFLKFFIGIGGLWLIKSGLKEIFPQISPMDFIRYFFIGLWVTALAPMIFKYLFEGRSGRQ